MRKCNTTRSFALLWTLLLLWVGLPVAAQETDSADTAAIEIVRLQHRAPEDIRRAIEPLLDRRGSIGQLDNNLIVATTRSNLAELKAIIEQLDLPRKTLRISVDFNYKAQAPGTLSTQDVAGEPLTTHVLEGETAVISAQQTSPAVALLPNSGQGINVTDQVSDARELHAEATVRGDQVEVELTVYALESDDGSVLTATTSLLLMPGNWQVVAPLDSAAVGVEEPSSAVSSPDEHELSTRPPGQEGLIAIRVDILP